MNVDKQHKLVRRYMVMDVAVLLPAEAGQNVWADSTYRFTEIDALLKATGLCSEIHRKGYRNKPLTAQ